MNIYQIKISLTNYIPEVEGKIWRRIHISENASLSQLHHVIQIISNLSNVHLYLFKHKGKEFGDPSVFDEDDDMNIVNSDKVLLKDLFVEKGSKNRLKYTYDFGTSFNMDIFLEKVIQSDTELKEAICIGGENIFPLEDSNGMPVSLTDFDKNYIDIINGGLKQFFAFKVKKYNGTDKSFSFTVFE